MNLSDKLMNIAIDGETPEETVVVDTDPQRIDEGEDEIVEETTLTRRVRRARPEPPREDVIIIED